MSTSKDSNGFSKVADAMAYGLIIVLLIEALGMLRNIHHEIKSIHHIIEPTPPLQWENQPTDTIIINSL